MTRHAPVRRTALIAILAPVLALGACGPTTPPPSSPSPAGFVIVQLEIAPGAEQFFASQHRSRIVAPDGAVLADWEITDAVAPIEVPAGTVQLQGFTVFLSDFLQCSGDPTTGSGRCAAPTLAPSQVCAITIEVVAGGTVSVRFRSLPEARCELTRLPTGSD